MAELLFKEESFKIIGVCMKIHQALGMGLKEINYKDAMEIDFIDDNIPYQREKRFIVKYKDRILKNPYYADYLTYDSLIVEVKSVSCLTEAHTAQALSYLAVSGLKLAILINFGERSLTWKRVVL